MKSKDLSSLRFGRLLVISNVGKNKYGKYKWLCQCDCGNICYVTSGDLNSGRTNSCGCLKKEIVTKYNIEHKTGVPKSL